MLMLMSSLSKALPRPRGSRPEGLRLRLDHRAVCGDNVLVSAPIAAHGKLPSRIWAALLCCLSLEGSALAATDKLDFNFQVRPILADRCFKCHGPDEKARKAKLRLDLPETAYAFRDKDTEKAAIVPGHPDQSEVCRRILLADNDDPRIRDIGRHRGGPPYRSGGLRHDCSFVQQSHQALRRGVAVRSASSS